uniref:Egg-laying hormone n=1 Tax=Deroceras reticulatum TaxID=145610 RepID=A0A1X9WEC7_DERRE|nr:egg-laying hormone [Deroceras reticulatum]
MTKDPVLCLVFMTIALNSWLPFVFAFAGPMLEDTQVMLPSLSEAGRDRAMKEIFLSGKARDDAEVVRSIEGFLPKIVDSDEGDAFYCSSGEMDKRRLRTNKRRLRESKREDKRRLRFVKRLESIDDDGVAEEEGLSPRLRFHERQKRETSLA